jgi:hypothetical protein
VQTWLQKRRKKKKRKKEKEKGKILRTVFVRAISILGQTRNKHACKVSA